MTTMPIYDLADEWNAAGTTFTAIKMNVTDTASAAGSLLMDLQVGGASAVRIIKPTNVSRKAWLAFGSSVNDAGLGLFNTGDITFGRANSILAAINCDFGTDDGVFKVAAAGAFGFSSVAGATNSADVFIRRDAANTLAQRNGTNAQAFRIYNTFTDASNYERGFMRWNSNTLEIGSEVAGTGSIRNTRIGSGSNIIYLTNNAGDSLALSSGAFFPNVTGHALGREADPFSNLFLSGHAQFSEMTAPAAPASNKVRIYAEDDGTGKTRLMALFATGAAQQIAIEP